MIKDFPGKRPEEKIIRVIQKHLIVYLRLLFIFLITVIVPSTIFLMLWSNHFPLSTNSYVGVLGYLGACFFLLYSLAIFLLAWLNEDFDIFILTNQRLVDITQVNFFKRTVNSTQLRNIEDTSAKVSGFFPSLFNYGDLDIQTASGDTSEFFMDHVSDPDEVGRAISNAVYESHQKHVEAISKGTEYPDKDILNGQAE